MPARPVLTRMDVPRAIQRVPRYIPEHQLEPLMAAIRAVECPLQRCALLVARWSGARRGEIRRLHLDCLDAYPDGTPRLRLAAGKALKERTVPVHPEAADAIGHLVGLRSQQDDRGIYDPDLGKTVRYLFLHNGRLADSDYLFAVALGRICDQLGILNADGKPAIHPHRFRHTLGTQLAEKGARTQTIMKILGHLSAGMSMTYSHISDWERYGTRGINGSCSPTTRPSCNPARRSPVRWPIPCAAASSTRAPWTGSRPTSTRPSLSSAAACACPRKARVSATCT